MSTVALCNPGHSRILLPTRKAYRLPSIPSNLLLAVSNAWSLRPFHLSSFICIFFRLLPVPTSNTRFTFKACRLLISSCLLPAQHVEPTGLCTGTFRWGVWEFFARRAAMLRCCEELRCPIAARAAGTWLKGEVGRRGGRVPF